MGIHGVSAAGLGHAVTCPLHPALQRIAEGEGAFDVYGGPVALEGMRTTCGATLVASQQQFVVERRSTTTLADTGAFHQDAQTGDWLRRDAKAAAGTATAGSPIFDERASLASDAIDGIPYCIETKDGQRMTGRATADGLLSRIYTSVEEEYEVFWGDEALARIAEGGQP